MSSLSERSQVERIRGLNDQLRKHHQGGKVLVTQGIAALSVKTMAEIFAAVAAFDDFNSGNDPYGEHDCATLTVNGLSIIWKIDYYDPALTFLSDDPANPEITSRVLTIMLASEY